MSINSATRKVRQYETSTAVVGSTFAAADNSDKDTLLGKLTTFVPTEVITSWAAALGFIAPKKIATRWLIFGIAELVLLLLLLLSFGIRDNAAKKKAEKDTTADPGKTPKRKQWLTFMVSGGSFAVWALASAGTPLNQGATRSMLGVALLFTILTPKVVEFFELSLPDS